MAKEKSSAMVPIKDGLFFPEDFRKLSKHHVIYINQGFVMDLDKIRFFSEKVGKQYQRFCFNSIGFNALRRYQVSHVSAYIMAVKEDRANAGKQPEHLGSGIPHRVLSFDVLPTYITYMLGLARR